MISLHRVIYLSRNILRKNYDVLLNKGDANNYYMYRACAYGFGIRGENEGLLEKPIK